MAKKPVKKTVTKKSIDAFVIPAKRSETKKLKPHVTP